MRKVLILLLSLVMLSIPIFAVPLVINDYSPNMNQFNVTPGTLINFNVIPANYSEVSYTSYWVTKPTIPWPTYEMKVNTYNHTYNFSLLGNYNVNFTATGLVGWVTTTITWNISVINDTEPPIITINTPDERLIIFRSSPFECSATDNVEMKLVTLSSMDDGIEICTGINSCSAEYIPTVAGTRTLTCTAEDTSGNINSASIDVTVYSRTSTAFYTIPVDGMIITENTTFYAGTYNLLHGVTIGANNVILDCDGATLIGDGTGFGGIHLLDKNNVVVKNCKLSNFWYGIWLQEGSNYNEIINNTVDLSFEGIILWGSSNNTVSENSLNNNTEGITLVYSSLSNKLTNNTLFYNNENGIEIQKYSNNNMVANNKVFDNLQDGILITESEGNSIFGNTINTNLYFGLQAISSNGNTIKNNVFNDNFYSGILLQESSNNTVIENDFYIKGIEGDQANIYCVDGIGNKYYNGATGPMCNSPPIIDSYSPTELNLQMDEGTSQLFVINASDVDGDLLTYYWYLNDIILPLYLKDNYTLKINTTQYPADYTLRSIVSDGQSNSSIEWNITVNDINFAPSAGRIAPWNGIFPIEVYPDYYIIRNSSGQVAYNFSGNNVKFLSNISDIEHDNLIIDWYAVKDNIILSHEHRETPYSNYSSYVGHSSYFNYTFDQVGSYIVNISVDDDQYNLIPPKQSTQQVIVNVFQNDSYINNFNSPIINIINPINNSTINTNSVWLNATTDENAICKYSLCNGIIIAAPPCEGGGPCGGGGGAGGCSAPKTMSTTGGISHSQLITNLDETINNEMQKEWYFIRLSCVGNLGKSNTSSATFYVNLSQADLKVTNIIFAPEIPTAGGGLQIIATIENVGKTATAFWMEFETINPNGSGFGGGFPADPTNLIEPSEIINISFGSFGPLISGIYNVTVTVHSEEPDFDLSNNQRTETVYVSEIPKPEIIFNSYSPTDFSIVMNEGETQEFTVNSSRNILSYNWKLYNKTISEIETNKIAFVSTREDSVHTQIYLMNMDGSNIVKLTDAFSDKYMYNPSWSPDGTKIAFTLQDKDNVDVYVIGADGTNLQRLTNNNFIDNEPVWSPDGSKIAFVSERDGNPEIYVMNNDGNNQIRLTNNEELDYYPSWSPDGSKIVFTNRKENDDIYVMNSDGTNLQQLTDNEFNDIMPFWSPDGSKIAFTLNRAEIIFHLIRNGYNIYTMNSDGTNQVRLINNPANNLFGSWSPDGNKIAFSLDVIPLDNRSSYIENSEIYIMNSDGTNQVRLTNDPAVDVDPHISPIIHETSTELELIQEYNGENFTFSPVIGNAGDYLLQFTILDGLNYSIEWGIKVNKYITPSTPSYSDGGSDNHPAIVSTTPTETRILEQPIVQENQPAQETTGPTGAVTAGNGNGNLYIATGIITVLILLGFFLWKKYH